MGADFKALTTRLDGFDWDQGDNQKTRARHGVTQADAEKVFLNRPVLIADDAKHSEREKRCALLGRTNAGVLGDRGYHRIFRWVEGKA